jgi:hypothetical protein
LVITEPKNKNMKKVLVAAAVVLASLSAHALDGQLILSNRGTGYDARVTFADGPKAGQFPDAAYSLQLFRVNGGSETAVGNAITFRASPASGFGYFPNTTFTIPNFGDASGPATFRVKAFDTGMTYDTAKLTGTYYGNSADFTATVNVAPTPPVVTSAFPSFGLTQVPEPSTIALAALGGAALLFRRRK